MHRQAFVGVFVFLLTMYRAIGRDVIDLTDETNVDINGPYEKTDVEDNFEREGFLDGRQTDDFKPLERRKRASFFLKRMIFAGVKAVRFLKTGAKKVTATGPDGEWIYTKRGNFGTAFKEFHHVVDQRTMDALGANDYMFGEAGDKLITLIANDQRFKGNPTIEIDDLFDDKKKYGKIIYVKPKKGM